MTWEQFYKELKEGRVHPVYFFYGPEEYIKREALNALRAKILPLGLEQFNETTLDGADAQRIIEAAETLPMMCERRLLVVRDYAPLMSGKAKNEAEESERVLAWLDGAPDSCATVFYVRGSGDSRKKLPAALIKKACAVQFDFMQEAGLTHWVTERAMKLGKKMEREAADALLFMAGHELTRLEGEVEKLCAYAAERPLIKVKDVEALVTPSLECTVFQLIDCVLGGQMPRAQRLYKAMLESGESRLGILAMLTRQMRMLTHIRLMEDDGIGLTEIEKKLSLNHYSARRAHEQALRFGADAARRGYEACVQADYDIKSGRARESDALERLLFTLDGMRRG